MTIAALANNKMKVELIYFDNGTLTRTYGERVINGEMYLERRPKGKWLCFRKGGLTTSIPLTKKMYKSLNRFSSGIKEERFYNIEEGEEDDTLSELDEECIVTEDDVFFMAGGREMKFPKERGNLPAVVTTPPKPKEKAPFIVQVFAYVPNR